MDLPLYAGGLTSIFSIHEELLFAYFSANERIRNQASQVAVVLLSLDSTSPYIQNWFILRSPQSRESLELVLKSLGDFFDSPARVEWRKLVARNRLGRIENGESNAGDSNKSVEEILDDFLKSATVAGLRSDEELRTGFVA